ncbi:hypothetical protein C488_19857 [Natrinema pellirubrum DSM 15624]|uniref:Uncharacterized protein n=1 Tax=Natrinema pellirubrum (strain DSM 15624 / CIP 106293 / JCM 10476 / NCIMB 786 / 157) TaxID=797303 RepID=L0JHV0_NATP1|nr:hypothetical protein [Natrinema pellirubrum]AGB30152.1 hypothetical protein Natpe_0212 [Natrinema pellirubrum DSM 15624]ELY69858.1 hypothetical protein C488_19857 [Natrinema pellirubrum DSM 15624]
MPPFAQPAPIGLEDRLLAFAVSLLVGGAALQAGTYVVAETRDYGHAVVTALLAALAWAVLESVPLIGGLLAIVAWIAVVKWRYGLGWLRSAGVGVAAWAAAVVVLAALELVGIGSVSALGVPGT